MKKITLLLSFVLLIVSCSEEQINDFVTKNINNKVVVSEKVYKSAKTSAFAFVNARIEQDNLYIKFKSAGCDGKSWKTQLVDLGKLQESNPPIRNVRFILDNTEVCEAYLEKEVGFSLKSLQVNGTNKVYIKIQGIEDKLLYQY